MSDQNDFQVAQQLGELLSSMRAMRDSLATQAADSKKSRKEVYETINGMSKDIAIMEKSVSDLDRQMKKAETSISNFENLKAQANGARKAVWWLWLLFGGLLLAGAGYVWSFILGSK